MENIVPSHAFVSSYDIRCSITLGMPDMKTSATGSRKVNRSGGEKSQNQVKLWTTKLTRVGQQTSGKGTCPKRKIWVCSYPPDQVYGTSCFPTKTSAICFLYLGKGTPSSGVWVVCFGVVGECLGALSATRNRRTRHHAAHRSDQKSVFMVVRSRDPSIRTTTICCRQSARHRHGRSKANAQGSGRAKASGHRKSATRQHLHHR